MTCIVILGDGYLAWGDVMHVRMTCSLVLVSGRFCHPRIKPEDDERDQIPA